MKPDDISKALRGIASRIDNSENPSLSLVSNALFNIITKVASNGDQDQEEFDDEEFDSSPEFEAELTDMLQMALDKGYSIQAIHDISQRLSAKSSSSNSGPGDLENSLKWSK